VDTFGPFALAQAYDAAWLPLLGDVARALLAAGALSVRAVVRGDAGAAVGDEHWAGEDVAEEFTAHEGPLAFQIRARDPSLSVGIFPDARVARERIRGLARGANVLNLFAYAGGFTVAAMSGGAALVDQVDVSARVASWAARNVAVNGISPRTCRFIVEDAGAFTARAAKANRRYRLVVMDPPTFGRSAKGWHATSQMTDLVSHALGAVEPGGRLMLSTNTRGQDAWALWAQVEEAASSVGCRVTLEDVVGTGADFPISPRHPHLQRFKMLQVRVD
jgi:23S rRNA (cytosine1962-C5)-methyltransferase